MRYFKTKYVTRDQIVEAIMEEPLLRSGVFAWGTRKDKLSARTKDPDCRVCAIGSILRRAALPGVKLNLIQSAAQNKVKCPKYGVAPGYGYDDKVAYLKRHGLYLSLLSCEFEKRFESRRIIDLENRDSFADWIVKNFPPKISLASETPDTAERRFR